MSKRILSLVLALVMVLGTFGTVFAANTVEKDAATFLKEAKILLGDDKGDLNLDLKLERRDMVILLSRLMGDSEVASKFPVSADSPTWKDVRTDAYYVPFYAWAQVNKHFAGNSEKEFAPRAAMTAQDYSVVLLRALGYDVEGHDAWKTALETAKKLGILADVTVENDTEITRGQMSVMTLNALGVVVKDTTKTLAEVLEIGLPTPAVLEVDAVVADNLKEVKVAFNKDVDVDLTDVELFSIKGLTIEAASVEKDMLVLTVKEKMTNKKEYELVIKGTKELDGTHKFTAVDNAIPAVVSVEALGTKAIKVVMSEPVQTATSTNFKLNGKSFYGKVEYAIGREIVITPYTALSLGDNELTVSGLNDYNNFKSLETTHKFEVVEDKVAPTVVEVKASLEKVTVEFSETVDHSSVTKSNVYWKSGTTKMYPESVEKVAGNKYEFTFSSAKSLPVYETTIYVENVKDYSGNKMTAAEILVKAVIDETRPEVASVELNKDRKTIIVKFNKSVNKADAEKIDNYIILDAKSNKQLINTITMETAKSAKIVLGKALAENKDYTIKISGIKDNNKYANVMFEYNGNLTVGEFTLPEVTTVTGKYTTNFETKDNNKNEIYVYFNKAMDLSTVVNPSNYLVQIGSVNKLLSDVDGEVNVVKADPTVVIITVEGNKLGKIDKIAALGVKDTNDKALSNYGVMFAISNAVVTLDSVKATAKDTIVVEFTQAVKDVEKEAFTFNTSGTAIVIDTVVTEGKEVTITLNEDTELSADLKETLNIIAEKVYGVNGTELVAVSAHAITDKVAPSLVSAVVTSSVSPVSITLEFDEALKAITNSTKNDLVVTRIADSKVMKNYDLVQDPANLNKLVITFSQLEAEINSAYEVTVKANAYEIKDTKNNVATKEQTKRTGVTAIAELPLAILVANSKVQAEYTVGTWADLVDALNLVISPTVSEADKVAAIRLALENLKSL